MLVCNVRSDFCTVALRRRIKLHPTARTHARTRASQPLTTDAKRTLQASQKNNYSHFALALNEIALIHFGKRHNVRMYEIMLFIYLYILF